MEIHHTLPQGALLAGGKRKYRIVSVLGKGGFGITYKAVGELADGNMVHKVDYAIKEFYMSSICTRNDNGSVEVSPVQREAFDKCRADFQKEARSLRRLPPHEGIVRVNEVFDANHTSYYVMEYLGRETLQEHVKNNGPFNEDAALAVFARLVAAVAFLHGRKRMHLDIKPENIMLAGNVPKLIDFGLSLHFKSGGHATHEVNTCCSDGYAPVEQYAGIASFSPPADIYALGAVLFFMLSGQKPVRAADMTSDFIGRHLPSAISAETRALVMKCMQKNADHRFSSTDDLLRSLVPLTAAADSNATKLIAPTAPRRRVPSVRLLRYSGLLLLLVLLASAGRYSFSLFHRSYVSQPTAPPADTPNVNRPADTPNARKSEAAASRRPSRRGSSSSVPSSERSSAVGRHAARTAAPAEEPEHSDIHDLGYALWQGALKDGHPHGHGTMTFKTSHPIDSRLDGDHTAQSGDRLVGEYINGRLVSGNWFRNGTKIEYIIIGD